MNQPEQELARSIVRHLDYGLTQLDAAIGERLAAARRAALARYRERPEPLLGLAWAGKVPGAGVRQLQGARHLLVAAALIAALVGFAYWQSVGRLNELAEIDASLLADDLPIHAYLDKGFDSWLKRSSR